MQPKLERNKEEALNEEVSDKVEVVAGIKVAFSTDWSSLLGKSVDKDTGEILESEATVVWKLGNSGSVVDVEVVVCTVTNFEELLADEELLFETDDDDDVDES